MIKYAKNVSRPCKLIDEFTVRKSGTLYGKDSIKFMAALCQHLIKNPDPTIVPILDFQYLGYSGNVHRYTYDMVRLGLISSEEKTLIDGFRFMRSNPRPRPTSDVYPKLIQFCNKIVDENRYGDLHSGNVMMNSDSDYLLVDLEGFLNHPLSRPSNNWITQDKLSW